MKARVFVTRRIPQAGLFLLESGASELCEGVNLGAGRLCTGLAGR